MILNIRKFNKLAGEAGASLEDLARAIDRPGLRALAAVRNWSRGNFSPKPRLQDIESLASALSVQPRKIALFGASHRWARIAPRKARLIADLIRGRDLSDALSLLRFSKKRAAVFVAKALDSAIASAEENDVDVTRLVVSLSHVDEGPTIKRFRPKDRGRSHRILKRTCHITVAVEEK